MGYVTVEEGRAWQTVARRARARPGASCARATAGSPWRRRATRRPSCAAGWRRSARSSATIPLLLELEAEGVVLRDAHRRPAGLVRPPAARAHPPLHARPPAARRSSPSPPRSSCASSAAGSTSTRSTGSRARAAWREVVRQLAGFEVPAAAWEASVLPARVRGYQREWLDQLTLSGEVAWGRLWGARRAPIRGARRSASSRARTSTAWLALSPAASPPRGAGGTGARGPRGARRARRAVLARSSRATTALPPPYLEAGLASSSRRAA